MSAADYEEMLARIASLKLRLPSLEGKANKKERTAVNKEIYTLENEPTFVEAQKSALCASRSEAAAADDAAHASRLREEAAAEAAAEAERAERLARKAAQAPAAPAEEDDENHNVVKLIRKGDGETKPAAGQQVLVTYKGTFAAETTHGGVDYSGKTFDTTWDPKRKSHKPLAFQLGAGRVIRGWEKAIEGMTLGEKIEVTIGPKWAYRKSGVQDDDGLYVVPPNATLVFEMELVGVGDKKL